MTFFSGSRRIFYGAPQVRKEDVAAYAQAQQEIRAFPAAIPESEIDEVQAELLRHLKEGGFIFQWGDCAEKLGQSKSEFLAQLIAMEQLAAERSSHRRFLSVGRMGGQHAKPRSAEWDEQDPNVLSFRGELYHSPDRAERKDYAEPKRLFWCAQETIQKNLWRRELENQKYGVKSLSVPMFCMSHEALDLNYESLWIRPSVRSGQKYLSSAHFFWLGARTLQGLSASTLGESTDALAWASRLSNPVQLKLNALVTAEQLKDWIQVLRQAHPDRSISVVLRMGADQIEKRLEYLRSHWSESWNSLHWMSDPMHGNTLKSETGMKVRPLHFIEAEAQIFLEKMQKWGVASIGLHLETTTDEVLECPASLSRAPGERSDPQFPETRTFAELAVPLCDPRLNLSQVRALLRSLGLIRSFEGRVR